MITFLLDYGTYILLALLGGMFIWFLVNVCWLGFLILMKWARPWTRWLEDVATKKH